MSARAGAFGQQRIAGAARGVKVGHGDAGEGLGFDFVGHDVVAEAEHRVVEGPGGRRVEDGGDAGRTGDLEPAPRGVDRLLELGDEDPAGADRLRRGIDIGRAQLVRPRPEPR